MSESTNQPAAQLPSRDAANWAKPVDGLRVGDISPEATNLNVEGKQLSGPLAGFGQMWQKTYRIRLSGADVTPEQVIKLWKENFATFWPKGNRFFGGVGIEPGQVAVLNLAGPAGERARRRAAHLHRHHGHLRRRRVLLVHDAAGSHVRRHDHVQRGAGDKS
ncbi:hypothetical protein [Candidatus Amarolinea dominans]|uniref:hypothetical protein n=1 Tax=Candidatus Amarolinea dominans TaxID=3140696 RepID=UPI001D425D68|nr:hypothetical protein [Anaerolineae bacterium]